MNKFEDYLATIFHPYEPSDIIDGMRYTLLNPGKRVRSNLFFHTLQAWNITKSYYEIGACIEMIHTYSLIHDDLPAMDNAQLRRNKPTLHVLYNEATAVLAGDGLLTHAFGEIVKSDISAEKKIQILEEVVAASGNNGMIYGQYLDLKYENSDIDIETLKKIHQHKTGNMIVLPLKLAAIIADKQQYLPQLETAGFYYGLAFQVKDDLLDVLSADTLGKDSRDEHLDKATFPKLLGIAASQKTYQELIQTCLEILETVPFNNDALIQYMNSLIERNT